MEKHKLLFFRIILIVIFALIGLSFSENIIYDYTEGTVTLTKENISFLKGYELDDNNQYHIIADDPQMMFDFSQSPIKVSNINIVFETVPTKNIPVQLFYCDRFGRFSEVDSVQTTFPEGENNLGLDFNGIKCTCVRLDIDGSFALKSIEITGLVGSINVWKMMGYSLCVIILLFFVWRYLSLRIGMVLFGFMKKLSAGYASLYEKMEMFFSKKEIKIQHVFCVLATVYGLCMLFFIPPNQVPDELTHYRQIIEASGFSQIDVQIEDYFAKTGVSNIQGNPLIQVDQSLLLKHMNDRFDKSVVEFTYPSINIIKHLPSAVLFFIGYFFNLPIYYCLVLSEIGSLIFYVIMGYLTLKYIPFKKELMCAILLLPMNVQQCASVNYDSVLIPISLFFTAYVFYCKYEKEYLGWKDLLLFLGIAFVVMKIKPTNFPIFLLVLLIPLNKWKLRIGKKWDVTHFIKKFKWIIMLTGVVGFCFLLYIGRHNSYIQLVEACFLRPDLTFVRIYHTLKELHSFYVTSMIADLGWLDTLMPVSFYALVIAFLFVAGQRNQSVITGQSYKIKWKEKLLVIFVSLLTMYMIFIAMFTWSMYLNDIDYGSTLQSMIGAIKKVYISLGVQGRYFLPIAFLFFIPFDGIIKINKRTMFLLQCIYYPVCICWSLWVVMQRYWI